MNGLKNRKGAATKIDGQGILQKVSNHTAGCLCENQKEVGTT